MVFRKCFWQFDFDREHLTYLLKEDLSLPLKACYCWNSFNLVWKRPNQSWTLWSFPQLLLQLKAFLYCFRLQASIYLLVFPSWENYLSWHYTNFYKFSRSWLYCFSIGLKQRLKLLVFPLNWFHYSLRHSYSLPSFNS